MFLLPHLNFLKIAQKFLFNNKIVLPKILLMTLLFLILLFLIVLKIELRLRINSVSIFNFLFRKVRGVGKTSSKVFLFCGRGTQGEAKF